MCANGELLKRITFRLHVHAHSNALYPHDMIEIPAPICYLWGHVTDYTFSYTQPHGHMLNVPNENHSSKLKSDCMHMLAVTPSTHLYQAKSGHYLICVSVWSYTHMHTQLLAGISINAHARMCEKLRTIQANSNAIYMYLVAVMPSVFTVRKMMWLWPLSTVCVVTSCTWNMKKNTTCWHVYNLKNDTSKWKSDGMFMHTKRSSHHDNEKNSQMLQLVWACLLKWYTQGKMWPNGCIFKFREKKLILNTYSLTYMLKVWERLQQKYCEGERLGLVLVAIWKGRLQREE